MSILKPRALLGRVRGYVGRGRKRLLRRALRGPLIRHVRARPRGDEEARPHPPITILLMSAWGMGGTIRTTLNRAGYLSGTRDVEIISVIRRRNLPFFGSFPPGVRVTALDDRRSESGPRGLLGSAPRGRPAGGGDTSPATSRAERVIALLEHLRRPRVFRALIRALLREVLRPLPSVLVHPAEGSASQFSLWTDLVLVRKLRGRTGILIGTRPGLNLLAVELSPPGMATIGEEHMHLRHHAPTLREQMRRAYPGLDAFTVLTEGTRRDYERFLGGRVRLAVLPNAVREDLVPGPADLDSKTILGAGRFGPQKGFDYLITAFARVAAAHADWRLRIVGRGQHRETLREMIEEHGLADLVTLGPATSDMGQELENAAIFALSSRFEGFPLVLLEAMSKRMAVVSFDCPTGPADIIDDHGNGILVPPEDVDALSRGLLEMVEDEDLRRRCAAAALETARHYRMDALGPAWDDFLTEVWRARTDTDRRRSATASNPG